MKRFLGNTSNRFGYDGWALRMRGADCPMGWTTSTTRQEARDIRKESPDLFMPRAEIVKVKITVEIVE